MKWVGHAADTGEITDEYRALVGPICGKYHFEDPGVDWRIIMKRIFRIWMAGRGLD
jgi:hypothetical protein